MFWRFALHRSSRIDTLLSREEGCTVEELLDESDILQECKSEKKELLTFLTSEQSMETLLNYISKEPEAGDEKVRFKYPSLASEVLSCGANEMVDALSTPATLQRLWGIVTDPAPIHPLIGSFFLKVFASLCGKKPDETRQYILNSAFLIDRIFDHLETPAIADVLMRTMLLDPLNGGDLSFQEWLCNDIRVVDRIVDLFSPTVDANAALQTNASLLLQDIVFAYRKDMSELDAVSPLELIYTRLMTEEVIERLLGHILSQTSHSTERGFQVVHDLLTLPPKSEEEPPYHEFEITRHQSDIAALLKVMATKVDDLHRILLTPPSTAHVITASGDIGVPLGSIRVKAVRLLHCLVGTNNEDVFREFERLDILRTCLDLFFQYPDNNFLHKHVADIILSILSQPGTHPLFHYLFSKCKVTARIMTGWSDCHKAEQARPGHRLGYMGHLGNVASCVATVTADPSFAAMSPEEEGATEWEAFVVQELQPYLHRLTEEIGGPKPLPQLASPSDDEPVNSHDFSSGNAAYLQYFQQQTYGNMADEFGYIDDAEPVDAGTQFGAGGDFGQGDEFQVESHDWTQGAADVGSWRIVDSLGGSEPTMPDDEWTEQVIEDNSAPVAKADDSDSSDDSRGYNDANNSDSDDERFSVPTQPVDVPLSPRSAQTVATMPTRDPFVSPQVRALNLDHHTNSSSSDDEEGGSEDEGAGESTAASHRDISHSSSIDGTETASTASDAHSATTTAAVFASGANAGATGAGGAGTGAGANAGGEDGGWANFEQQGGAGPVAMDVAPAISTNAFTPMQLVASPHQTIDETTPTTGGGEDADGTDA